MFFLIANLENVTIKAYYLRKSRWRLPFWAKSPPNIYIFAGIKPADPVPEKRAEYARKQEQNA